MTKRTETKTHRPELPRVLPFALFMAFVGLEQGVRWLAGKGVPPLDTLGQGGLLLLYPVKALAVALLLALFWRHYREIRLRDLLVWKDTGLALLAGVVVFVVWILLDVGWARVGQAGGYDPGLVDGPGPRGLLVGFRLFGAVLVVPVMEELFWRSFLMRWVIDHHFDKVPVGAFTWPSLLVVAGLFALAHHLVLAGFLAGILYALVLYRTRSLAQCILSHALTNLLLGWYVLQTGSWSLW